jgi:hypothetical protein
MGDLMEIGELGFWCAYLSEPEFDQDHTSAKNLLWTALRPYENPSRLLSFTDFEEFFEMFSGCACDH